MNKTTEIARNIDGKVAPFYLAYRVSHRWGGALEERSETHEHIIDADVDANVLRERVNAHFALPRIIDFERRNQHVIPPFAMSSRPMHGSGGGCDYNAHIEIREAPILRTKTCGDCDGRGDVPNPDPQHAKNRYFNVPCTKCDQRGVV